MNIFSNNTTTLMPAVSEVTSEPSKQNNIFITVNQAENKTLNMELAALISIIGVAIIGVGVIIYRHFTNTEHRVFVARDQDSQNSLEIGLNGEDTRAPADINI
jgi:hypothetical protein